MLTQLAAVDDDDDDDDKIMMTLVLGPFFQGSLILIISKFTIHCI